MYFDVTPLFDDKLDAYMISNSPNNLGENVGRITWDNALEAATDYPLVNDQNRDEVIQVLKGYGAWEEGDLLQWNNQSLSALVWQFAASDFREHWEPLFDGDCFDEDTQPAESMIHHDHGKFYFYFGT